jgi:hypothetical protein
MCHNFVDPDCRRKKGDPFDQHFKPQRAHLGQTNVKENNLPKNSNNNKQAKQKRPPLNKASPKVKELGFDK